jgi:uncharacterized protein YoxC
MTYALIALSATSMIAAIYFARQLYKRSSQIAKMSSELSGLRARLKTQDLLVQRNEKLSGDLEKRRKELDALLDGIREHDKDTGGNLIGHVFASALGKLR